MEIDKGLIGGSTVLMLLALLKEKDRYGYEIIKELKERSDSTFEFKEGTLYPVLHRMENAGLVKSYRQEAENGKTRKYYRITPLGEERLEKEKKQWEEFSCSVNKVIGGGAHAFA
ncbi:MAG: PadR family transcriptional regulator [Clostridiales bacterium]|nr:PadR family transcriptional regulator [Clostridiales bacterium]